MSDEDLAWVDAPNCSEGHPYAARDRHEWRPPEERPAPRTTDGGVEYQPAWVPFRSCSFCGSIHPEDLLAVLRRDDAKCLTAREHAEILRAGPVADVSSRLPPVRLEWADMKYGHPHKLYVRLRDGSGGKFRVPHLVELPDATFDVVALALAEKTRILFARDPAGTKWQRLTGERSPS